MGLVLTVEGVVKEIRPGWTIETITNGRDTLDCVFASPDATYRPAVDDEIILVESFGSSASSQTIGTGSKTFTVQAGLYIVVGERLRVYRTSAVLYWMEGTVTSYSGTTLTLNVETINGSGTYADWTVGRRIFGGEIQTATEHGAGGVGLTAIETEVSAIDFNAVADRRHVSLIVPAGTLKQALQALDDYLPGITLDPNQVNGPSLEELRFDSTPLADALAQLEAATGYVRDISYYKFLRFWLPGGTEIAPFNISTGDGHAEGDVSVETSRVAPGTRYANRVFLKFSAAAIRAYAFLTASANFSNTETVTLGSQTYTFQTTLVDESGNVKIGASTDDSLNNLAAAIVGGAGAGTLYGTGTPVNSAASAFLHISGRLKAFANTAGASGNSIACTETCANAFWHGEGGIPTDALKAGADEALTNTVQADDAPAQGTYGIWEIVLQAPDVFDFSNAQALAEAYLDRHLVRPQRVTYTTRATGIRCGQTQSINLAARNVNDSFLLTEIGVYAEGNEIRRSVTAVEGAAFLGNWRQVYQQWGGAGTVPTVVGGGVSGGGAGGGGGTVYFLGGSAIEYVDSGAPAWVPLDGTPADPGTQVQIDTTVRGSTVATVVARLRAYSGTVTARLRNVTDATTAGTSTAVNSTTFQTVSFQVTLADGNKVYRMELLGSIANVDIAGIAYLE